MEIEDTEIPLKSHYVYELVNSLNGEVFYVGKGLGQRAKQHEFEAARSDADTDKISRIKEIKKNNGQVVPRVVGRYETEEQAFAVEATLIHWVYGLEKLSNIQGGHGCSTIRSYGELGELEGIDIPKPVRRTDGAYTQSMKRAREENNIVAFMEAVKFELEQALDIGFSEPDTAEANKTKIYSYFGGARIRVGAAHSKTPSLWVALEPVDSSPEAKARFAAIAEKAGLDLTKSKRLARLPHYKGTRDMAVLVRDLRLMIQVADIDGA